VFICVTELKREGSLEQTRVSKIVADKPTFDVPPTVSPARSDLPQRLVRAVGGWGGDEVRHWQRVFGTPAPWLLLLLTTFLFTLAWQFPLDYSIDNSRDYSLDQPFLENFNLVERTQDENKTHFIWSKGEGRLIFAGAGKRDYIVRLSMAADANPNKNYVVFANNTKLGEGTFEPGIKTYEYRVPESAIEAGNGDLRLRVTNSRFSPPGDNRVLGFVLFSARIEAQKAPGGFAVPPFAALGWLVGTVMLLYAIVARAGFGTYKAAGVALVGAGVFAYVVAIGARPWLTMYPEKIALAFGWALLMVLIADIPLRRFAVAAWERRWVLSIFGILIALRLTGLFQPQATLPPYPAVIDLGFHQNRFADLWQNGTWWAKITSAEWGNRETYYPHASYLLIGLFQWLVGTSADRAQLLLLLWLVTVESSRALLVYYLARKVTGDGRTAVMAALFMAVLPINNLSVAWAQVANLFGEWFILVIMCLVVIQWDNLRRRVLFGVLTATILASFIVHPGEVILSGITLLFIIGIFFWRKETRQQTRWLLAAYVLAIALAFGVYHWQTAKDMIPQALQTFSSRLQGGPVSESEKVKENKGFRIGGQVRDDRMDLEVRYVQTLPELLVDGFIKGTFRELVVYYYLVPLLMFPWGLWWLWQTSRGSPELAIRRRMFWLSLAWLTTVVIFWVVSLTINLYVRHWVFMLPIVAIGAAIFLGQLWKRLESQRVGWVGATLTVALFVWMALSTAALFLDRMIYYQAGL
jgi:4-amino-4-deoxy-L-arabinose transferase-like glycosyltransferase